MDQDTSLDIQHILFTDEDSPIDITTQLQLQHRLPQGRKTCEELLKTPALQQTPEDQGQRIHSQFVFYGQCLVLGDSQVGKTSLVKSLTGEPFDPMQAKTQGIDQYLVDEQWKTLDTTKDLMFGNFSSFFKQVLFQLTFFGKAGNITVQESTKRDNWFTFFGLLVILIQVIAVIVHLLNQSSLDVVFYSVLAILTTVVESCAFYFKLGHFLRSIYVLILVINVIERSRALTIGAFLSVVTKGYFSGTFMLSKISIRRRPGFIYVCFAVATVAVLVSVAFFLFRDVRYNAIERKCLYPGQFKFKFVRSQRAMETILFGRFVLTIFIAYIVCLAAVSLMEVSLKETCNFVSGLAIIWHMYLAFQLIPRITTSLSGRWPRKAKFILVFICLSCVSWLLPSNVYFAIIYTAYFCVTLYVECFNTKLSLAIGDQEHHDSCNVLAAVLIERALLDRKQLKRALNKKFSSLKMKILDFAGDREYYAYHHMFLKSHAIYIIVFNIAKFVKEDFRGITAGIERLKFWFESICSHVPPKAPIFLVGTHRGNIDKNCMEILDEHLKINLWDTFCDELVLNDVDKLIFYPVENSKGSSDTGVQVLQKKIMSVAEQCKGTMGCNIPLSWIRIQDAIISLKEKKDVRSCVTLEEFPRAIDRHVDSTCTWTKETLKYFHEKGLVIFLDKDQDLPNWVLLEPEILVDIIIQLVTPPLGSTQQRGLRRDWNLLQKKGILTNPLLKSIINKIQENEEAITAFLEEYDLICPLVNKKVGMCTLDDEQQPTYFIPSLLPMSTDEDPPVWDDDVADKKFYVFFDRFLPQPLFHRLLSRAHKNSKVEFLNGPTVLYRDAGKFWMSAWQPYMLKLMIEQKMVEVTFSCSNNHGMKPADVLCQVFSMVDGICKRDFPYVKFHCGPACPSPVCPGHQDDYLMSLPAGRVDQATRTHVYNVMPGRQGNRVACLYCRNHSFQEELDEWIP